MKLPIALARQMTDEAATLVALLHDVAEDTFVAISPLAPFGFLKEVLKALCLLTHDKTMPYFEYIKKSN